MSPKLKLLSPTKSNLINFYPVLVFFTITLIFFITHYKEGFFVLRGDTGYPLNPTIAIQKHSYSWFDTYMNGQPAGHAYNFGFPILIIIHLLNKVFNPQLSQFLLLSFLLFSSGFLSYFFFSKLNEGKVLSNFLGALFFMVNPIIITEWYVPNPWFLLAYSSIPLIAISCYYLVTNYFLGVSLLVLSYLFIASSFANVPLLGINIVSGFLIIIYLCNTKNIPPKKQMGLIISYFFIFFLANFWWLGLLFLYRIEGYQVLTEGVGVSDWARLASRRSHIIYIFQNQFTPTIAGRSFEYTRFLTNPAFSWINLIFPLLIFGHLFRKNREKRILFLLGLIIIILFFTKGVQKPFGFIYHWFLNNVPYFAIFKTPSEKFGVLLIFLTSLALSSIDLKAITKYSAIIVLIAFSYPVFSGSLFPNIYVSKDIVLKAYQKVDPAYYVVAQKINEDKMVGRVLLLPATKNYMDTYKSTGFRGLSWSISLINKPVIKGYDLLRDNLGYLTMNLGNAKILMKLLKSYNINWILLNKDIDQKAYGFMHGENIATIEKRLDSIINLKRVLAIKHLVLYKVKSSTFKSEENPLPRIYSPPNIYIIAQ